jgi:FkbM family methyltransferase
MIIDTLPFFCIHVGTATDRRKHFEAQFERIGVRRLTVVDALTPASAEVVDHYGRDYPCDEAHGPMMVACFASHLRALHTFVEGTTDPYAIVCEDDVCFRKDFGAAFERVWDNMPEGCPLIALSYWHTRAELTPPTWAGRQPSQQNLAPIGDTAGALLYLISRAWAIEALLRFDRPFRDVGTPMRTSEAITLASGGLLAHPPLAIERPGNTSLIKPDDPGHVAKHVTFYQRWNFDNFFVDDRYKRKTVHIEGIMYSSFRPAFSPKSCYLLRDSDEERYFGKHGGAPEADLIAWATEFIKRDQIFVDVGAHVGSWAQHFAQVCKQVHAFEPQLSTFERLREGACLAELDNIVCHNTALGGSGEMELKIISADGGGSTLRHRPEMGDVLSVERVQSAQLDDFVLENVGLIKIDAEGFEIEILRGAAKTLEQRPTLLLEAWDHDWYAHEREQLIEHVRSLGYDVTPVMNWPQTLLVTHPLRSSLKREPETSTTSVTEPTGAHGATSPSIADQGATQALIQRIVDTTQLGHERPLLGLVMIVKNEARRIVEVLASYRSYIDAWTILDTGSTDGTQDLIRKELDGIAGTLHEEPFVDFATSRNRALELHGTATMFSIMPNGDVLSGGPELRTFLEAHRRDFAGAYRVRISPGHYYHPLVMRTGMGWRYKWRTHECAMGPHVGSTIPDVFVNRDRGARSDEEWRARWTRDLDLLNRDRAEDPSDPRPYFYLGQTHECLGQFAQALPFFERRAEMGGYFDEVFEAKFRIGKMKEKLDRPWAEIQQAYLEAYAHDPRRAEPLYAISEHWYNKGLHAISRIFAVAAAETPKPPTDLFLDEDVYTWKSADRAAISSFYSGHKEDSRYWADIALSWSPNDERLRSNRAFSAPSASELFGATARPIEFSPEPGWNASNPSIYADGDRVRCVVRTVNYRIVNGSYVTPPDDVVRDEGRYKGWQMIRTRNFLLDLDADLKTTRTVELVDATGEARTGYPVHGFEDARLFAWEGKWWATSTVCDFTEDGAREIALLQIEDDGSVVRAEALRGPWSVHAQKNWMPLVDHDVVKFVYATQPTTIFELVVAAEDARPAFMCGKSASHAHHDLADYGHGRLRGGSQGVRVDGGWIFVVHDVAFPGGSSRTYLHRFVLLDDKLQLVSMTDPFYFEQLGIEFCAGLAAVGDKLVASYAVNDGSARLGVFDGKAVRQALRKKFVI